jgi:hypothetical protein
MAAAILLEAVSGAGKTDSTGNPWSSEFEEVFRVFAHSLKTERLQLHQPTDYVELTFRILSFPYDGVRYHAPAMLYF